MLHTVPDCSLDGHPIPVDRLPLLTSDEISRVVGLQQPGSVLEDARHYRWSYQKLSLEALRESACDGDEPEGGWKAMYLRQKQSDEAAVKSGSPEYAGRQECPLCAGSACRNVRPRRVRQTRGWGRPWSFLKRFAQHIIIRDLTRTNCSPGFASRFPESPGRPHLTIRPPGSRLNRRQQWCEQWASNSAIYPLFVVHEGGHHVLWDGHHRLASAFWHEVEEVWAFVGVPR